MLFSSTAAEPTFVLTFVRLSLPSQEQRNTHNGYNLVVGDLKSGTIAYASNRQEAKPSILHPGAYGLSNSVLSEEWVKVEKGKTVLQVRTLRG